MTERLTSSAISIDIIESQVLSDSSCDETEVESDKSIEILKQKYHVESVAPHADVKSFSSSHSPISSVSELPSETSSGIDVSNVTSSVNSIDVELGDFEVSSKEQKKPPVLATGKLLQLIEVPTCSCLRLPYKPAIRKADGKVVQRPHHGVQHASRVALWALIVLMVKRNRGDQDAIDFPDYMIPILIKACMFHDSGREDDGVDKPEWEATSGNNLAEHLRNCGESQTLAWQCGQAICYKDQPEKCVELPKHIQVLRSLLHDADVLDVMRARSVFYLNKLDCFTNIPEEQKQDIRELTIVACNYIAEQGKKSICHCVYYLQNLKLLLKTMAIKSFSSIYQV